MQLVITEKPSVAKSIAEVLHATEHKNGYLQGNGYLVSWCVGHLVELASADIYREEWICNADCTDSKLASGCSACM